MLSHIVALLSLTAVGSCSPRIVGAWRSDNGKNYAEIYFREDHSLILLLHRVSMKIDELFVVTDLGKEYGTWYIEGDKLKIDVTSRPSRERRQATVAFTLVNDVLEMQNIFNPTITDTYRRLNLPTCIDASAVTSRSLSERDIIGRWLGHYHTHDFEFVLEAGHRATTCGEGIELSDGEWHLDGGILRISSDREPRERKKSFPRQSFAKAQTA